MSECITDATLHRIELDVLSPSELAAVESHVTQCDSCQDLLDSCGHTGDWQDEILPALTSSDFDGSTDTSQPPNISGEVLSLLGPTDDPNMLGRIGSYEISGVIGRGGMGVVFKAFDPALDRFVAIKMLAPHLAASGAARKRFTREGKAAAAVVDDHVLPVYQVDHWQGIPYLVMQYSRGVTLQQRLNAEGPLATEEILRIGLHIAKGLAAAHSQGLVHRDVKPSNILLSDNVERAMLTDFGLARAVDDASMTKTGVLAGTPQYMSPEQARGETVNQSSDLFSLGSVIYSMCTARAPFRADNSLGVMRLITEQEPRSIQELNSTIPEWLCELVHQLMSKNTEDRPVSAKDIVDCLEACLAHFQQPATSPLPESLSLRDKSSRNAWVGNPFFPLTAAVALIALVAAGVMIVLEYGKGTISISSEVTNVPIRIVQGDETVREMTLSKGPTSIRIAAGKYRVYLDGKFDDVVIKGGDKKITLFRGETELVEIIKKPNKSNAILPDAIVTHTNEDQPTRKAESTTGSVSDALREFDAEFARTLENSSPTKPHLNWSADLQAAKDKAAKLNVPLLVHFYSKDGGESNQEEQVLSDSQIAHVINKYFMCVKIDADQSHELIKAFEIDRLPTDVFIGADGKVIDVAVTPRQVDEYLGVLKNVAVKNRERLLARAAHKTSATSFVSSTGTWELEDGVTLQIIEVEDDKWGEVTRAILRWPAQENVPALWYEVDIASQDHMQWAVAWKKGDKTLWLLAQGQFQSGSSIRSVDYRTPASIVTCVGYGDDHFDLRLPELSEYRRARRRAYSIGSPWKRLPKSLDRQLVEHFNLQEARFGISSLLPTGPYMAGGQYAEPAFTEQEWSVTGIVTDAEGQPVADSVVSAQFNYQPSVHVAQSKTDSDGRFQLNFSVDIYTLASSRQLQLACEAINAKTDCFLLLSSDEKLDSLARSVAESIEHSGVYLPKYYGFSGSKLISPPVSRSTEIPLILEQSPEVIITAEKAEQGVESEKTSANLQSKAEELRQGMVSVAVKCEQGNFDGIGWLITKNQIIMPSFSAWMLDLDDADFEASFRLPSGMYATGAKHKMLGSLSLFTLHEDLQGSKTIGLDVDVNVSTSSSLFAVDNGASLTKGKATAVNQTIRFSGGSQVSFSQPFKFHDVIVTDLPTSDIESGTAIVDARGQLAGMLIPLDEQVIAISISEVRTLCDQLLGSSLRRLARSSENLAEAESSLVDRISLKSARFETAAGIRFGEEVDVKEPYGKGLIIESVEESGPAQKQGLKKGDVLVGLGEWMTKSKGDVTWILKNYAKKFPEVDANSVSSSPSFDAKFHVARGDGFYWGTLDLPKSLLRSVPPTE